MREKTKCGLLAALTVIALVLALTGICLFKFSADAEAEKEYGESYRNKLAYSAYRGWNNDPNGLLYADGVYHMYYQYNSAKENVWGNMSWGHATSADLVSWTEQPVAIPAWQTAGDSFYGMFFSGSAVYDENNTSGLFEGKGGIVAIMTQPCWNEELGYDVQRQILAYSVDGTEFKIYGELALDGGLGDNEFRDPKVFWNEKLGKWLMAIGGGSVRMYSSENLLEWEYLGETGFWGECPDVSRFEVGGEEKYVLIISPEDKDKSHAYNGTNRVDTPYPAEYYTVGELDESGLFIASQPLKRLSEGIDSYAFQSFNNSPDGKVYGISWSASWLTVDEYRNYRQNYNGGMTVACELALAEDTDGYTLIRKPVEAFEKLRGEKIEVNGRYEAGKNPFANVKANEADVVLELDFSDGTASYAELDLRVSASERIKLTYEVASNTLSLDRSQSSLLAENTKFYKQTYSKKVPLTDGKLGLRILLDRAFISVFANGGYASFFSAVFPSAISDGIRLISDGSLTVNAEIYKVNGIFGNLENDELWVTTDKIDMTVGEVKPVIASSFGSDKSFNFEITDGAGNISIEQINGTAYIRALKKGSAEVRVGDKTIEVYIYENGLISDVDFTERYRGFSYVREDGLFFGAGGEDAFLFGDKRGKEFEYSAYFNPLNTAQAGGLAFGYNGNPSGFWFVTADVKENRIKLVEFCGEKTAAKTLQSAKYNFDGGYKLTVSVGGGVVKVYADNDKAASIICRLDRFSGGRVGVNVFDAEMSINNITFKDKSVSGGSVYLGADEIIKVVNTDDGSYRLKEGDFIYVDGVLTVSESYLSTLEADTEYNFRAVTSFTSYDFKIKTSFAQSSLVPLKDEYLKGDVLSFAVSGGVEVYKIEINGKEFPFERSGDTITVAIDGLIGGTHTVKAYTAKGRPYASFTVSGEEDFREDEIELISHTFFYIDIAIFAALILAYVAFTVIRRYKSK